MHKTTDHRSHPQNWIRAIAVCGAVLAPGVLSGCVSMAIGAGATVGLAAYDERGIEGVARDTRISTVIRAEHFTNNTDLLTKIGIEVSEGRVLLTGIAPDEALRAEAVRLAWMANGVKDVINEIQVDATGDLLDTANDTLITAKLRAQLTTDSEIYAVNYAIETVAGTVYVIGIAQNQGELDRVIAHARDIARVRRVVSHVRVKAPAAALNDRLSG